MISTRCLRRARYQRGWRGERGVALVVALMAMMFMLALGTALLLMTGTELKIARNFRNSSEALYAADAVLERVVAEIRAVGDWSTVLSGVAKSAFADGSPAGARALADGSTIDLGEILNIANCQKPTACSSADLDAVTPERPWGIDNPRWQPFAWGFLDNITSTGTVNSPFYVFVMVAGSPPANSRSAVLAVRAEAFGPFGTHKLIELTVAQTGATPPAGDGAAGGQDQALPGGGGAQEAPVGGAGVSVLSWREVR